MMKIILHNISFQKRFPCFLSVVLKKQKQQIIIFEQNAQMRKCTQKQDELPIETSINMCNQYEMIRNQLKFTIQILLQTSVGKVKLASITKSVRQLSKRQNKQELKFLNCPDKNAKLQYTICLQKNQQKLDDHFFNSKKDLFSESNLQNVCKSKSTLKIPDQDLKLKQSYFSSNLQQKNFCLQNLKKSWTQKYSLNQRNNQTLTIKLEEVNESYKKQKVKNQQGQEQLTKMRVKTAQLQKKLSGLYDQLLKYKEDLSQERKARKNQKGQALKLLKESEHQLSLKDNQVQKLGFRQNLLRQKLKDLTDKLSNQQEQNRSMCKKQQTQKQKLKKIQALQIQSEKQFKQSITKLQNKLEKSVSQNQSLAKQIVILKNQRQKQHSIIEKNKQQLERCEKIQKKYLDSCIKQKQVDAQFKQLQKQMIGKTRSIQNLKQRIEEFRIKISQFQQQKKQKHQNLRALGHELKQKQKNIKQLNQQIHTLQIKTKKIEHIITSNQTQKQELKQAIQNLSNRLLQKQQIFNQELKLKDQILQQTNNCLKAKQNQVYFYEAEMKSIGEKIILLRLQNEQMKMQINQLQEDKKNQINQNKISNEQVFQAEDNKRQDQNYQHEYVQKLKTQIQYLKKKLQNQQKKKIQEEVKNSETYAKNQFLMNKKTQDKIQKVYEQLQSKQKILKLSEMLSNKRIKELQSQNQVLKTKVESKQNKYFSQKAQIQIKNKKTIKNLADLKNQIKDKQLIIASFKSNIQKCQMMISQISKNIDIFQKKVKSSSIPLIPLRQSVKKVNDHINKLSKLTENYKQKQSVAITNTQNDEVSVFQTAKRQKLNKYRQYIKPQKDLKESTNTLYVTSSPFQYYNSEASENIIAISQMSDQN